jgi:ATP-binding protein involved in chromosome partitioning
MSAFDKVKLPTVKNIIVVASGKGGVGKSTVAANLAIALSRNGHKTALVDADIFGPSIPKMFGIEDAQPEVSQVDEKDVMFPIEVFGVKIMSIGFFVKKNQGLIWRGPMAANAIMQLFENTIWGEIDYMVVDFPPGTSDIQLTTVQKLNINGAIIVTTPQEIALNDARKAASLFNNKDLKVPILGVVENMSWFTPKPHPDEKYFIFGSGGGEILAKELGVKVIAQIPLVSEIGELAEKGFPVYSSSSKDAVNAFDKMVEAIT